MIKEINFVEFSWLRFQSRLFVDKLFVKGLVIFVHNIVN